MADGYTNDIDKEAIARSSYEIGQVVALESLAKQCRALSGEHFAKGNDDAAGEYRRFAMWIEDKAKQTRGAYNEKWRGTVHSLLILQGMTVG